MDGTPDPGGCRGNQLRFLGYSAQSTSSCCFGPSQSQTVQPKSDTASRPWVPKPSVLSSEISFNWHLFLWNATDVLTADCKDLAYTSESWRKTQTGRIQSPTYQARLTVILRFSSISLPPSPTAPDTCRYILWSTILPLFAPAELLRRMGSRLSSATDAQNALSLIPSSELAHLMPAPFFSTHFSKSNSIC